MSALPNTGGTLKRLIVFAGYDRRSVEFVRRVKQFRDLFDEVLVLRVPEESESVLRDLGVPYAIMETEEEPITS